MTATRTNPASRDEPPSDLQARLARVMPEIEFRVHQPLIEAINRLKKERDAVILAHNYQTPEIFHGVADVVGDSLRLAREAARTDATRIVVCGVHFMAETAKLLNPDKTVLIPDVDAGCSLAESITPQDVQRLRAVHPDTPVVAYVNTSAAVKALSDVCCTSANAVQIVESLGVPRVIMIPDVFLARNVAASTAVEIIAHDGRCIVHEQFRAQDIRELRETDPQLAILAHPECPPDVLHEADFAGSTEAMARWVGQHRPRRVVLLTECSMSDNVAVQHPEVEFQRPCNLCPYMKRITLTKILDCLASDTNAVTIPAHTAHRARQAIERMLQLSI
jgi:quinolinate synthase